MTFVKPIPVHLHVRGLIPPNPGRVMLGVENLKKLLVEAGEEPVLAGIMGYVPVVIIITVILVLLVGSLKNQLVGREGEPAKVGTMGHAAVPMAVRAVLIIPAAVIFASLLLLVVPMDIGIIAAATAEHLTHILQRALMQEAVGQGPTGTKRRALAGLVNRVLITEGLIPVLPATIVIMGLVLPMELPRMFLPRLRVMAPVLGVNIGTAQLA